MVCPSCKVEAVITKSRLVYKVTKGEFYRELTFTCRNKKCKNYKKEIGSEKHPLIVDVDETEEPQD